jgi:hypothetical protein
MPVWLWVLMLAALIKLPIAGLMLWIPFRNDDAVRSQDADSSEEDGGSKALPGSPVDPHPRTPLPRRPRRGPHGTPPVPPPRRTRTQLRSSRRVRRVA